MTYQLGISYSFQVCFVKVYVTKYVIACRVPVIDKERRVNDCKRTGTDWYITVFKRVHYYDKYLCFFCFRGYNFVHVLALLSREDFHL